MRDNVPEVVGLKIVYWSSEPDALFSGTCDKRAWAFAIIDTSGISVVLCSNASPNLRCPVRLTRPCMPVLCLPLQAKLGDVAAELAKQDETFTKRLEDMIQKSAVKDIELAVKGKEIEALMAKERENEVVIRAKTAHRFLRFFVLCGRSGHSFGLILVQVQTPYVCVQ